MMDKIRIAAIGLAIIFLTVSEAAAWMPGGVKQGGGGAKDNIFKELNLTPEQQQKLGENRKAQREKTAQLRQAVKEKREELRKGLESATVTRAAVEPLVGEIKSLVAQLIDNRLNGIFAVKEILTPEQFSQFNQIMEKRKENKQKRFEGVRKMRKGMVDDGGL